MSELSTLRAIYWGQAWLDALRSQAGLPEDLLIAGESYARHDWELDVFVDKGRAEATAGAGRRLEYDLTITLPVFDDEEWQRFLSQIARSSSRTAAIFDASAEPALIHDARAEGLDLMPQAGELAWKCDCQKLFDSTSTTAAKPELCKHVGAVLYLLADTFDEDAFDLLLMRGRTAEEIRTSLGALRSDAARSAPDELAEAAWVRSRGPLPSVPAMASEPGAITSWASDPPPSAPFTAVGLQTIGIETAQRAWELLTGKTDSDYLDLPKAADLARRAAALQPGSPAAPGRTLQPGEAKALSKQWKDLVARSELTTAELSSRVAAWQIAGAAGVDAQMGHAALHRVGPSAQLRQSYDGNWFRFEKRKSRWTLVEGPSPEPDPLLREIPEPSDNT